MDQITVTILPNGSLKVETPKIGSANHANADAMIRFLETELGGETTKTRRAHTHHDAQEHVHLGEGGPK